MLLAFDQNSNKFQLKDYFFFYFSVDKIYQFKKKGGLAIKMYLKTFIAPYDCTQAALPLDWQKLFIYCW